jgi:hypothetical protein
MEREFDTDKIDDAALALLFLTLHADNRVWKGIDWEVMNRLHDKGYILDPRNKNKSVALTEEGRRRAEEQFWALFGKVETESNEPETRTDNS